jgi:hypothetical protein
VAVQADLLLTVAGPSSSSGEPCTEQEAAQALAADTPGGSGVIPPLQFITWHCQWRG